MRNLIHALTRPRNVALIGGSLAVLAVLTLTDPDGGWIKGLPFGGPVLAWLLGVAGAVVYAALAWMLRKALHDYDEADMQDLFKIARQTPEGAGRALQALAIVFLAICLLIVLPMGSARAQVPQQAVAHLPALQAEIRAHWPDHPMPSYFGGLIEHESCISLTHSRCWSPTARLRTQREEGAGLGQITRTWHADGRARFDTLAELRSRHPALASWSWSNVYERVDLQLRAVVLFSRDLWRGLEIIRDPQQRLAMTDAAYNGGPGRVVQDRRACGLKAGCDPQRWWGHVEHTCTASRAALYGRRSACDINRHHVRDVILTRAPKYSSYFC